MSAKFITTSSEENQNLKKHMCCMTGIFQLFHHSLTGSRLSSHFHKKLLPGFNYNVELACAKETDLQRNCEIGYEKHRTSTESSSTSSLSSFASVDHNTSSKENPTPLGRQSPDLRDVVKDAMHREARSLSIKMVAKEQGKSNVMKHIDSPRPLHNPKSWKPGVTGADGSTQSLEKYFEAPRIAKEEMDTSGKQKLADPSRFSYDSAELREATRSSRKLKEFPTLSLDSRDTIGRQASHSTPKSLLRDSEERGVYNQTHEPSCNKRLTVIAKLIGLEPFSDHPLPDQYKITTSDRDSISRSSLLEDLSRKNNIPLSPRLQKDSISQEPSRTNVRQKTPSNSRLTLEQAPFRMANANGELHHLVGKNKRDPAKGSQTSSTVCFQIDKGKTDLEFKGSGKNLRALKQILETKQKTRIMIENQQEEVNLESQSRGCRLEYSSCNQKIRLLIKRYEAKNSEVTTMKSSSPHKQQRLMKRTSPPISKVARRCQMPHIQDGNSEGVDSERKQIGRHQVPLRSNSQQQGSLEEKKMKGKLLNTLQKSKEIGCKKEENLTVPTKSLRTMSPRTRHKNHVLEKKNQNSPSDLCMARAQLSSPNRKSKVKSSYQQGEDRKNKLDMDTRDNFHEDDTASPISVSNNSSASQMDTYFTSTYSYENRSKQQGSYKSNDLALRLRNKLPTSELVIPTAEQPSPISVLDASFYREDSPSPVKKISIPFTDDDSPDADAEWSSEILDHLQETRVPNLSVELFNKKTEDIRSLVHKLDQLSYASNVEDDDHDQVLSIIKADMDHQAEGWKHYRGELPSLVLDIERLIFKDLITNVINDEITSQQDQHKHSKKLCNN